MAYLLKVTRHPLGVVVTNPEGHHELLIDGETCCGVNFSDLVDAADRNIAIRIEEPLGGDCRLRRAGW